MAGYFRVTLGLGLAVLAVAVLASRALPRWTAGVALVAGAGFCVDGMLIGEAGFTADVLPDVAGWLALAVFALTTTAAAWTRPHRG